MIKFLQLEGLWKLPQEAANFLRLRFPLQLLHFFLDEASKVRVSLTNVVADTSTETSVITSCLVDVASVCESVVIALIFMVVSLVGDSVVPATLGDGVPSVEISIELGSVVIGIT